MAQLSIGKKIQDVYVENLVSKTGKEYSLVKIVLVEGVTLEYYLDSKDLSLVNLWLRTANINVSKKD